MSNEWNLLKIAIEAAVRAGEKTLEYFAKEISIEVKKDNSPLTLADIESNKIINRILKFTGIPVLSEENEELSYKVRKKWSLFWMVDPLDGTKEFIHHRPEYTINIALIDNHKPVLGVIYVPVQKILYYSTPDSDVFKVNATSKLAYDELADNSVKLPLKKRSKEKVIIISSRSHISEETLVLIEEIKKHSGKSELVSIGSSLKFCLMAEGFADIYPRFGPTMEWDSAAGHVIARSAGCRLVDINNGSDLTYNKKDLYNPSFIAYHENYHELVRKIIL
jgi:3'(2'), 5'-bisphosphate nucleotidase